MEQLNETPFSNIALPKNCELVFKNKTIFLVKFNWDFEECEKFQLEINSLIQKNKDYKFIIITNHPHIFTIGRGNERDQGDLIDFDPNLVGVLNFPVHKIYRGGGITFHYPGQWIIYPICAISPKYTLDDHMCWVLKATKKCLEDLYQLEDLITAKKLMGIWVNKKKLASIGVGLHKYVSLHGLALNFHHDDKMFAELSKINPCGLDPNIYQCVEDLYSEELDLYKFTQHFMNLVV